jgi:putative FmdB family regulatory protein
MPIYAYRCEACGHAKDVLQKLSDPVLTTCPACGAERFVKQVTAAGFQLKGSGWYVTDFRNGNTGPAAKKPDEAGGDGKAESSAEAKGDNKGDGKGEAPAAPKPDSAVSSPAPAAAPAPPPASP